MTETISRDDIDAAWMAGIWDGEGCIHTAQRTKDRIIAHGSDFTLRLELRNTSPYMMQRVTQILTKWKVKYFMGMQISKHSPTKREQLYLLIQSYRAIEKFLSRTIVFFTAKKDEAQIMLDFCRWRIEKFGDKTFRGASPTMKPFQEQIRLKITVLHHCLRRLKRRQYRLQRLPRGYSEILNLDKLEIWYPE
jgi:hypothetical protein